MTWMPALAIESDASERAWAVSTRIAEAALTRTDSVPPAVLWEEALLFALWFP